MLRPTHHAAERWRERVDAGGPPRTAEVALAHLDRGVAIPFRHAVKRWRDKGEGHKGRLFGMKYLFTPRAIGVCHGDVVVTVIPADVEDLATVLVWLMTGQWLTEN